MLLGSLVGEGRAATGQWLGDMGDFWVFGYGSLIWNPGFAHVETRRARLHGFRRSLCVYSFVHRGTPERPGLVLGLDRGGSCIGLAFRVPGALRDEVLAYLRGRELVTSVYLERTLPVRLGGGETVNAVAYIVDRGHEPKTPSAPARPASPPARQPMHDCIHLYKLAVNTA